MAKGANRSFRFACSFFAFFLPMAAQALPIQWSSDIGGNDHYYEAVDLATDTFSWNTANADANLRTYAGLQGHLATLTSAAETAFIVATFPQAAQGLGYLIGGFQAPGSPEPAGGWQWVTGEPFVYTNWAAGEPNNSGGTEDVIHLRNSSGQWNDLTGGDSILGSSSGYLIEYSFPATPTPEPETMALLGLGLVTLWANRRRNPARAKTWASMAAAAATMAISTSATSTPFVDQVVSFTPGSYLFGALPPSAGTENNALGAPDPFLVSLGISGQITLRFTDNKVVDGPGVDLQINAFQPGSGSQELDNRASVFVSNDGLNFTGFAGFIGPGGSSYHLDLAAIGFSEASYVRIVDSGSCCLSGNPQGGGDGFNVESVVALNTVDVQVPEPNAFLLLLAGLGLLSICTHASTASSSGSRRIAKEIPGNSIN
jgi:hypothetical protein